MNRADLNKKLVWGVQLNKLQEVRESLAEGADPNCCGHLCLTWALHNSASKQPTDPAASEIVVLLLKHGARWDEHAFNAYFKYLVLNPQLELLEAIKDMTPAKYLDDALCRICEFYLGQEKYIDSRDKINVINFLWRNASKVEDDNVIKVLMNLGIGIFAL